MHFHKILIANRGEIAVRVIRTAHALGYRTVAVYSAADAEALHVRLADQSVAIGPPPVAESYLDIDRIIDAARRSGADAVHPGYGFLSENADFAEACATSGLTFVGPPAEAIRLMGNKRLAKQRMAEASVACVPGYDGEDQSDATLTAEAQRIGFPIMVKAAAGGGGRGMRLVGNADDLAQAIAGARSEAENAFGSGELLLEKAIVAPRHVEIQVFADRHGNAIHLGERDCSVQRRHQKVVEEAPSPAVTPSLRAAMGAAAVAAARAIDYVGAGTVEFLLDAEGQFYFLEMNTRLQVEHPVTEMITGQDLVAWQLNVAAGETLPLTQDEIQFDGHAIEVRLYAEDPAAGFLPQTGRIVGWQPADGPGLRVDHGIAEGQDVTPYYDPMLAKVIAHGATREEARRRLVRALDQTSLLGVASNKSFLMDVLAHEVFAEGAATTAFIEQHATPTVQAPTDETIAVAAALLYRRNARQGDAWRSSALPPTTMTLLCGDETANCILQPDMNDRFRITVGERDMAIDIQATDDNRLRYGLDGIGRWAHVAFDDAVLHLDVGGQTLRFAEQTATAGGRAAGIGDGRLLAPMAGRIVAVHAAAGATVARGDIVVVLEAMKMEHEIKAPADGTVAEIAVADNQQVDARQLLAVVEAAEGTA